MGLGYRREGKKFLESIYEAGKDLAKDLAKARALKEEYPDVYVDEYSQDANGIRIYLGSRGEKQLNIKQLARLRDRYVAQPWSEEGNTRLIAELADMKVVDSKIALCESGLQYCGQKRKAQWHTYNYAEYLGYLMARLRVISRELERNSGLEEQEKLETQFSGYEKLVDTLQLVYAR